MIRSGNAGATRASYCWSGCHHYLLNFVWDKLLSMAAAKCLVCHIVEDPEFHKIDDCLLVLPKESAVADVGC